MKHPSLYTSLALSIATAAVACSSPPPDPGYLTKSGESTSQPTKAPTKGVTSSNSSSSSGSATTSGSTDDATTISACVAQGADSCGDCCDTAAPSASSAYNDALDACLCGSQGHCQAACGATECSDDDNAPDYQDGDACSLCIDQWAPEDGTGACDAALAAAINSAPDGSLFNRCNDACPDSSSTDTSTDTSTDSDGDDDGDSSDDDNSDDFSAHVARAQHHVSSRARRTSAIGRK